VRAPTHLLGLPRLAIGAHGWLLSGEQKNAFKSPHTIADYRVTFQKLKLYFKDDPPFASITRSQLVEFFAWLQNDYTSQMGE
jgi:hypothetical protein